MKKLIVLSCIIFLSIHAFSQRIDLALHLDKGSNYTLSSNSQSTIHQDVNGQLMEIVLKVDGKMNFFVQDTADGQYIMLVKYDMLSMETTTMGQTMKYSSESDNEYDIMSKVLSTMTGKTFTCHMGKDGSVSHISGLEKLWQNMIDSVPGLTEANKMQLQQQMEKSYGNEAFQSSMEASMHIFPDFSVTVNEIWYIKTNIGGIIPMEMECDYVLAENAEDHYKIYGSAYIQSDKEKITQMNGMDIQYRLKGEYNSDITVNKESGWIIASKSDYFLEGEIFIMPNAQVPDGMSVPFRLNSTGLVSAY